MTETSSFLSSISNVISPKALEKQLKLVDARIQVLKTEMDELEKIRSACLTLMGPAGETPAVDEATESRKPAQKKSEKKSEKKAEAAAEETYENLTEETLGEPSAAH